MTNNRNVTINGLSVNVNGYEARNDNDLADTICPSDQRHAEGGRLGVGKVNLHRVVLGIQKKFLLFGHKKTLQIS